MNSIVKVTDGSAIDIMLVRAIAYDGENILVFFMRHDEPLMLTGTETEYLDLYTKWKNYAQWKLSIVMGEYNNG